MYSWKGRTVPSSPSERLGALCLDLLEALVSGDNETVGLLLAEQARETQRLASQANPDPEELGRARERILWLQHNLRPMLKPLGLNDPRNTYGPRRRSGTTSYDGLLVRAAR